MSASKYDGISPPTTGTVHYIYQMTIGQESSHALKNTVMIFDTGGDQEEADVRPLLYGESDMAVICFDISNRDSMDNCCHKVLALLGSTYT